MIARLPELALMPIRQHELASALAGLRATGVPLVGLDGGRLVAAGASDAPGLYTCVPLIARALGISLPAATTLFLGTIVLAGAAFGIAGWVRFARGGFARAFGTLGILAVSAMALVIGDSYTVGAAVVLGGVPMLLARWRRSAAGPWWATAVVLGLVAGAASTIRNGSGLPVAVFAGALLLAGVPVPWRRRLALAGVLVAAMLVPALGARALMARRDAYLAARVPGFQPPVRGHVFWHTAYIGFGFLSNNRGLLYRDEVGMARVAAVDPSATLASERYEAILRGEVLRLVAHSPGYVARTLAAKLGILGGYLVLFANLGLFAARRRRQRDAADLAFAAALAIAALPGLIAIPVLQYLEGFAALALLWGAMSVERWLSPRSDPVARPGATVPTPAARSRSPEPVTR